MIVRASTPTLERDRDVTRKRLSRAAERTIGPIPACAVPSRRAFLEEDAECWLRYYIGTTEETYEVPFTDDQRAIIDDVLRAMREHECQAIAAPRGDGKTMILRGLIVYAICIGLIHFPVIISKSKSAANESILSVIKGYFEDSDRLCEDYPEVCYPIRQLEKSPRRAAQQTYTRPDGTEGWTNFEWSNDGVTFPRVDGSRASGAVIRTRGADSAIRGLNTGPRPDFVLIDDPDDDESARSELQAEKRGGYIRQGVAFLGTARRPVGVVMLTTIPAAGSVSDTFTDPSKEPAWRGRRIAMLKSRPERADLWEQYVDLKRAGMNPNTDVSESAATEFYLERREEMDAGAEVSNPNSYKPGVQISTVQACYDIIAKVGEVAFETEYQNNPPREAEIETDHLTAYEVSRRLSGADEFVVPAATRALTVFVDLGKYRLHWSAVASKADASAQVVAYGFWSVGGANQVGTEKAILVALRDLEDYLVGRPWRYAGGEVRKIDLFGVDAGNWNTVAYQFAQQSDHPWRAMMGLNVWSPKVKRSSTVRPGFEYWESKQGPGLWVINQNTSYWKRRAQDGFRAEPSEPGSVVLFGDDDRLHRDSDRDKFASHIVAEQWVEGEVTTTGKLRQPYMKQVSRANHYLDTVSGALCLAGVLGVRPVGVSKSAADNKPRDLAEFMGGKGKKRGGRR